MKTIENLKELSDEQLEELRCDIENEQHKRIDKAIQARFVCPFCREDRQARYQTCRRVYSTLSNMPCALRIS